MKKLFELFTNDKTPRYFGWFLAITLLYFFYKGISYAMIGSFVPLLIIALVIGLLLFTVNKSSKSFRRMLGAWAALVFLWAIVRLLLISVNLWVKPIPEGHVSTQLGILGAIFSFIFLIVALYLWRNKKYIEITE